jgi:HK97 family phage prohead protease
LNKENYYNCPFEIKKEDITDAGIFEGFGSTFGGKPDSYGDIITEGAFKETLRKGGRNGTGIAMLWQHKSDKPIGVYQEVVETEKGLKVRGELALEVQQGKEAYILMKMGALNGLSIGWDFLRDKDGNRFDDAMEMSKNNKIRYLKRLELWEISPVTFPANTRATITTVKAVIEEAKNIREFEHALRDEGLSIQAAKYIASLCKPKLEKKWNKDIYNILYAVRNLRKKIGG